MVFERKPSLFFVKILMKLWCTGWLVLLAALAGRAQSNWSKTLPGIGTFSSPRVADLNGDGVGDIILGAGKEEFVQSDTAVLALDGRNGDMLWRNSASDQLFISPGLLNINQDGVQDVVVGGRSRELMALDGRNGQAFWRFDTLRYGEGGKKRWFNFYNPQFIDDQDGDGVQDILIANGGDIAVAPYNPHRAAGRLVVLSSRTGKLLAEATMPDGKEIYMSISALKIGDDYRIIFGTGGETVGGNLFVGTLKEVLRGDLSTAKKIATSPNKGFIAPPAWVDVNSDGQPDVVAVAVDGRLLAFDGKGLAPLWSTPLPGVEAYSSVAIGNFTDDTTPDFFVSFARGVWPKLEWTRQYMLNGTNGAIEFSDSLGYYQTSSAVAVDVNGDGRDEALLSINFRAYDSLNLATFYNTLMVVDFTTKEVTQLFEGLPGQNISSTPWVGDLDDDGFLDIVFCHSNNRFQTYVFDGMQVDCLKTKIPITTAIKWGSYMGSHYDGIYPK